MMAESEKGNQTQRISFMATFGFKSGSILILG